MARAVQVAHGGLLGYRAWTTSGGLSDPAIYDAYQAGSPCRHAAGGTAVAGRPGRLGGGSFTPGIS